MFPFPGGGEEDDDMDFVPSSSSKLASLFGLERPAETGGNASLTYTAPKQPGTLRRKKGHESGDESGGKGGTGTIDKKSYQQSHQNSPKLDLISAKPVTTYKLEKEGYTSKGMLGVAIQGSHRLGIYHLILYDREKLRVTDVKIVPSFQFTVQANNYATFYDEDLQNWSIMFFSTEAAVDFARERFWNYFHHLSTGRSGHTVYAMKGSALPLTPPACLPAVSSLYYSLCIALSSQS